MSHSCINGTLQGTEKYSAPVPVIGLYIAAASAVCALLMLYDIVVHGYIKRQRWLPCKWFKLNSVTLSLIGVVVKLTVDLTTSMPSVLDQLSKLAGTTSLCIYMCYIYPSISAYTHLYADSVSATVKLIRDFLKKRSYSSTEELGNYMQDLFVNLLNIMLAQLPDAIFKAVSQSPDDEFEERVRQSLKHLCMFESWDGTDKWKPPQGFENYIGLFDPKEPAPPNVVIQNHALASPNDTPQSDVPANPPVQDEGEDQGDTGIQLPATLNEGNEILSSEEHHVTIADEDGIVEIQSI